VQFPQATHLLGLIFIFLSWSVGRRRSPAGGGRKVL